jgi:hypothetical protein
VEGGDALAAEAVGHAQVALHHQQHRQRQARVALPRQLALRASIYICITTTS